MRSVGVIALLLTALAPCAYAFDAPDSSLGNLYLRALYDGQEKDLSSVRAHLWRVNAGYLTDELDSFLLARLDAASTPRSEKDNILGFYARQSLDSRAGLRVFAPGRDLAPDIVRIGLAAELDAEKYGCLALLEGIRRGEPLYKPGVWWLLDPGDLSLDALLRDVRAGEDISSHWSQPT